MQRHRNMTCLRHFTGVASQAETCDVCRRMRVYRLGRRTGSSVQHRHALTGG